MAISSKIVLKIVWDNAIICQTRQWKIKEFFRTTYEYYNKLQDWYGLVYTIWTHQLLDIKESLCYSIETFLGA